MKAVIMAGGQGTRIASVASDIPKPMIPVLEKPILEYQFANLKKCGIDEVLLIIGHLGHRVREYFGEGEKFGIRVVYYEEASPLGTAGALFKVTGLLDDDFLLINGDLIFDLDLARLLRFHEEKGADITLVCHPNSHPFDSAILESDSQGRLTKWINKEDDRQYYSNRVNAGIHVIKKDALVRASRSIMKEKVDLDRDILKPNLAQLFIATYDSPEYIKDMGTPDRYAQVVRDVQTGLVARRNLSQKQIAFFLDRDGTLNEDRGFISDPEQLVLLPSVAKAVREINQSGYLAILITNQPVVARGECSLETLETIHKRLETLLGAEGAYLDGIFFCPHHPDKGFVGERPELKVVCSCRKPSPGMLLEAAEKFNIDLTKSFMIGDDARDVRAGKAAGCRSILIGDQEGSEFGNLAEAVQTLLPKV